MFDFIKNIGPTELIVVLLILIVFFGGKAITRLARTGGETINEVKKVKKEFNIGRIRVIAGIGAREYFYKQGYSLDDPYVSKKLN